jgi:hypothetical protein
MQASMLLKKKVAVGVKTNLLMSLNGDIVDQIGAATSGSGYSFLSNQKFGRKAATFQSTGGINIPLASKITYAGDFTIECWMSMSVLTGEQMLFTAGPGCYIDCYTGGAYNGGKPCFIISVNPSNTHASMIVGNNNWTVNTLHHLAVCRLNGTMMLWGDGASLGTVANSNTWGGSTQQLIGNYISSPSYGFSGGVQELRMSNVCRYSAPFTPPTGPFTID